MQKKTHKDVLNLLYEIKKVVPNFRIVEKKGAFWSVVNFLVYVLTFGKNKLFNYAYITTLGPLVAVPVGWIDEAGPDEIYSVLLHEFVHLKQIKRLGFGIFWLGIVPFLIAYLLLPLPVGFAYCRYLFEREAYTESLRFDFEMYGEDAAQSTIKQTVDQLSTGAYGWTMPFPEVIRRYFDAKLEEMKLQALNSQTKN
jgi:uncharacterized membrane protein